MVRIYLVRVEYGLNKKKDQYNVGILSVQGQYNVVEKFCGQG